MAKQSVTQSEMSELFERVRKSAGDEAFKKVMVKSMGTLSADGQRLFMEKIAQR